MDTSKEYIEMCKAEEIQQERPIKKSGYGREAKYGDYFYNYVLKETRITSNPSTVDLWLPRQDQLQEMYHIIANDYQGLFKIFGEEIYKTKYDKFKSPEQLWLAFVMYEKFNKVWDGKEWIKKND